mgnify:CR=1 FL=1
MDSKNWLKWVLLAGVFLIPFIPFIISTTMFFPFITGKNFTFRIIVELLFGGLVILALRDPDYRPRFSWVTVGVLSLFGAAFLSTLFSVDGLKSFWSNFERMEGFVGLMHLTAWFFIAGILLNTEKLWNRFLQVSLVAAVIMGMYAMVQLSGFLTINQGGIRLDGTLGNAIYMAVYMLFHVFLALFLFARHMRIGVEDKMRALKDMWMGIAIAVPVGAVLIGTPFLMRGMFASLAEAKGWLIAYGIVIGGAFIAAAAWGIYRNSTRLISMFYTVSIVIAAIALYYTATRSATLGLLGGLLVAAAGILVFEREQKELRKAAFGIVGTVIVLVGAFFAVRNADFVQTDPVLTRFASLSFTETTVGSRFMIWKMAGSGIAENPVLGWGLENFSYVFNKYYNPNMWGQEQWFDRAHNAYLDWGVAAGIPGLLAFLSLFLLAIFAFMRAEGLSTGERSILIGLIAAYGFHSLFVFDNLISSIFFFLVLALAHSFSKRQLPSMMALTKPVTGADYIGAAGGVVVVTLLIVYFLNVPGIATAKELINALTSQKIVVNAAGQQTPGQKDPLENLASFDFATSNSSLGRQEATEQLTQAAVLALSTEGVSPDVRAKFATLAQERGAKMLLSRPDDARLELFYGSFLAQAGDVQGGREHLEKAHALSPMKQAISFELALNIYMRAGESDKAIGLLKEAFNSAPAFREAAIYYAIVLMYAGQLDTADAVLTQSFGNAIVDDDRLLRTYADTKRFDRAIEVLKLRVQNKPTDAQARISLAATYKEIGDLPQTIAVLRQAKIDFPQYASNIDEIATQLGVTL